MATRSIKEPLIFGVIGLMLGILLASSFASYSVNTNNRRMMGMMGISARHFTSSQNTDANFIEQMIPHHESAIAMAELAKEKSKREEIKSMADDIIKSQSAEITQMRQWYQEWYSKEVPKVDTHDNMMMDGNASTARLGEAADFDKAFLDNMIPHHQMAVMMANMLKLNTERPEMKKLADDIVAAQTKEIENMKTWQRSWGYDTTSSGNMMNMMHGN
jgi:uncharacterized protein (DUF305 family)